VRGDKTMRSDVLKYGQRLDLYCVDCDNYRWQRYQGTYADGMLRFLCEECGCENAVEPDREVEDERVNEK
jgi:hypothetical protein